MVQEKVEQFLERFVGKKCFDINENIFESGLVNSLFAMQLVTFIEDEFDISLENEDIEIGNFKSVNSITNLIESKMKS